MARVIINNDITQNMARGAVIIAAVRSGGTFLSHCLSNHSQIFCTRGEPLHHRSVFFEPGAAEGKTRNRRELLAVLLTQTGYRVSMCKLTYMQACESAVWLWLVKWQPRVIWLRRENAIRQAVSLLINERARAGKLQQIQHTFRPLEPVRLALEPGLVLKAARGLRLLDGRLADSMANFQHVYRATYREIVGGEGTVAQAVPAETAAGLCEFLGVRSEPLGCDLTRTNPYPLAEILSNWREVSGAIAKSEFAATLEDEWTS